MAQTRRSDNRIRRWEHTFKDTVDVLEFDLKCCGPGLASIGFSPAGLLVQESHRADCPDLLDRVVEAATEIVETPF